MFEVIVMLKYSRKWQLTWLIVCTIFIDFSFGNKYLPKSPDDENIINSEGMWQKEAHTLKPPTKISQGASRFDVSGILTAIGLKQGASIFALVVFPILFPLMILLGLAMFVISLLGSGGLAFAGRRSDRANSDIGSRFAATGYKQDRYGFPISPLTNRDGLAFDAVENDTCVEKFVCEILLRGGSTMIGKKSTLQLLQGLNVKPIILLNSSPGKKSRKVWNCSTLKCDWEKWIPWSDNTTANKS